MSDYVSVLEFRSFKDKNGDLYNLAGFTDIELQSFLAGAEELITRITHNKFASYNESWLVDGTGDPALIFTPRITYPLLSVTRVEELDSGFSINDTFVEDVDFVNRGHYLLAGRSGVDPYSPRVEILSLGNYWSKGLKNYRVVGIWGMGETPEIIKRVIKLLAMEMLSPGVTQLSSSDVESFRLGDYAVKYRANSKAVEWSSRMTGFPELDRLIMPFISYAGMIMNSTEYSYLESSELVT